MSLKARKKNKFISKHKKGQRLKKNVKMNGQKEIEQKCIKLFGSKKKANKWIKQAIVKGNSIRTKTKHLRYSYEGYQIVIQNNDIKTNKKMGIKSLINIDFEGNKTAERISKKEIKNDKISHANASINSKSSNYPSLYPSEYQYSVKDKILILGEMDFSYSLDIASNIGGKNIIATAYYNKPNLKKATAHNIKIFEKLNGKQVLFGIDATDLSLNASLKFDKILFGFPRNSESPNSQKHNVVFMKKVFEQVQRYLEVKKGQFQLLFHINQSGRSPLEQWKIKYPEWECAHEQVFEMNEVKTMFPLYQSHDGQNEKWTPYRTQLCVFKLRTKGSMQKLKAMEMKKKKEKRSSKKKGEDRDSTTTMNAIKSKKKKWKSSMKKKCCKPMGGG